MKHISTKWWLISTQSVYWDKCKLWIQNFNLFLGNGDKFLENYDKFLQKCKKFLYKIVTDFYRVVLTSLKFAWELKMV